MKKKPILLSLVFTLAISLTCCSKLPPSFTPTGPVIPVPVMPAIPLASGDLIAVTPHATAPHWVALWFQKPDKTISVRWVNIDTGNVGAEIIIPRK